MGGAARPPPGTLRLGASELVTLPQRLPVCSGRLSPLTASPRTAFQVRAVGSPCVPSFQLDETLLNMLSCLSLAPLLLFLRPLLPSALLSSQSPEVGHQQAGATWGGTGEGGWPCPPLCVSASSHSADRPQHRREDSRDSPAWGACGSSHHGTWPPAFSLLPLPVPSGWVPSHFQG